MNDIGGWTDTWFSGSGRVLNLAIRPGVRVDIRVRPSRSPGRTPVGIDVRDYGEHVEVDPGHPDLERHPLLQAAVAEIGIPGKLRVDIVIESHVPPGSALGTSAAVTVALLAGMARLSRRRMPRRGLAETAHRIETERLGLQSGIQDQIAAARGGICYIEMPCYPAAEVEILRPDPGIRRRLNGRLCLVYLGRGHVSSSIHAEVIAGLSEGGSGRSAIDRLKKLAPAARLSLVRGDLEEYGRIMIENSRLQGELHPALVSDRAKAVIETARRFGAAGWKINGAGGEGGSLSLLASTDRVLASEMRKALGRLGSGIRILSATLSGLGVTVHEAERSDGR